MHKFYMGQLLYYCQIFFHAEKIYFSAEKIYFFAEKKHQGWNLLGVSSLCFDTHEGIVLISCVANVRLQRYGRSGRVGPVYVPHGVPRSPRYKGCGQCVPP